MDVGMAVVVPMRMPVARGMAVKVSVGRGRGRNHPKMLYYNITPVHALSMPWLRGASRKKGGRACDRLCCFRFRHFGVRRARLRNHGLMAYALSNRDST